MSFSCPVCGDDTMIITLQNFEEVHYLGFKAYLPLFMHSCQACGEYADSADMNTNAELVKSWKLEIDKQQKECKTTMSA